MSRLTAPDRMKRLLAIVPWVAGQDEPVTLEAIAERFAYPLDHLQTDLCEMVPCVGTWPRDPYDLIDLIVDDDGRVSIFYNNHFTSPLRLTPSQAVALVGSATAARGSVEDSDALTRAIDKLAAALGITTADALDVRLGAGDGSTLGALRSAIAETRVARIDYYSHGRDERTTRDIEPHEVRTEQGAWYVLGWCRRAEAERLFRLERIVECAVTDEQFVPRELSTHTGFFAEADTPTVTLQIPQSASWVVETAVVHDVQQVGDALRVRLPVSATSWLERLLLQLGDQAAIVEAGDGIAPSLGATAAAAVLERYNPAPS